MILTLDNKYYTIKFTCNFSTTIPCHPKSEDVGQTYTIDKACPQCLPHPLLVNAIFDRAHFNEVQALKKAQGETIDASSCDINQSLSTKLARTDDDSKSISGGSAMSTSMNRHFVKSSFQILKSVVTRPRRKKIPTPQIIITPPEEDTLADADSEEMPALESAEDEKTIDQRRPSETQWESFIKKATEIQSGLQNDRDEETKRKDIERRLEETEKEVMLERVKAVEVSLEQLS